MNFIEEEKIMTQKEIELFQKNIRLVYYIALKYRNRGLEIQDLISEGRIALIEAIKTYDESKSSLGNYAHILIEFAIKNAIYDNFFLKTPRTMSLEAMKFCNKLIKIEKSTPEKLSIEKISDLTNYSVSDVKKFLRILRPKVSLDANYELLENNQVEIDEKMYISGLIDNSLYEDISIDDLIDELTKESLINEIFTNVELSDLERTIIFYRYGFDGSDGKSLRQIAKIINSTAETVRTKERKILNKIRDHFENRNVNKKIKA